METTIKYTKKQRLNNECTHREYYSQFINSGFVDRVVSIIGADVIEKSTDKHLNDISLSRWDSITPPLGTGQLMKLAGTWLTQSDCVCLAKEAARQHLDKINPDNKPTV